MNAPFSASVMVSSEDRMTALGRRLAHVLIPGDTVLLRGPIGAGKTHLARAIIQERLAAAELFEDVPSPTYTLVQVYTDGETEIWHADLYRLSGPQDAMELGLEEAFETAIVLIEWPDRLGEEVPEDALDMEFRVRDEAREIRMTSPSTKWTRLTPALAWGRE